MYLQCLPPELRSTTLSREKDEIIKERDEEITALKGLNRQYEERLEALNKMLEKALSRG